MATIYKGFQTYVDTAPSFTYPYGRFIAGLAADDGDLDDAEHLMALAMAAEDSCQWLGWRVNYLNPVEGSTGNPALTATITNYNQWTYNGNVEFSGAITLFDGTAVFLKSNTAFGASGGVTFTVGSTLAGVGHLIVDGASAGSNLRVVNGAPLQIESGSLLRVLTGGFVRLDNVSVPTADPGNDGALFQSNIIRCVANFTTDGVGGLSVDGGYNFASVVVTGTGFTLARVTFARPMTNAHYCVKGTVATSSGPFKVYTLGAVNKTTTTVDVCACATLDAAGTTSFVNLATTTDIVSFTVEVTCPS